MKPLLVILLQGILFVNIYSLASAETTLSDDHTDDVPGLSFTRISAYDITVSWRSDSFDNDTSYRIEVYGEDGVNCNTTTYACSAAECSYNTDLMSCRISPIDPCSSLTFNVIGNTYSKKGTKDTSAAPYLSKTNWNLERSISELANLVVTFGPTDENDGVKCATQAEVSVSCGNIKDSKKAEFTGFSGSATFNLVDLNCPNGTVVSNVTYMINEDPTETKNTTEIEYSTKGLLRCYECDSSSNTNCNDAFNPDLGASYSRARYIACAKEDGKKKNAKRYGIMTNEQDGVCDISSDACNHCSDGDGCNGAPLNTASITFFAAVLFIMLNLF